MFWRGVEQARARGARITPHSSAKPNTQHMEKYHRATAQTWCTSSPDAMERAAQSATRDEGLRKKYNAELGDITWLCLGERGKPIGHVL